MYTDGKEQLYAMGIIFRISIYYCCISCFYTCCNMLCIAEDCKVTN